MIVTDRTSIHPPLSTVTVAGSTLASNVCYYSNLSSFYWATHYVPPLRCPLATPPAVPPRCHSFLFVAARSSFVYSRLILPLIQRRKNMHCAHIKKRRKERRKENNAMNASVVHCKRKRECGGGACVQSLRCVGLQARKVTKTNSLSLAPEGLSVFFLRILFPSALYNYYYATPQ